MPQPDSASPGRPEPLPQPPRPPSPPRSAWARLKAWLGQRLARYLSREPPSHLPPEATVDLTRLAACLQPGDVLLVEGNSRFSIGIKYLTQSTWSHAALYVGDALAGDARGHLANGKRACVIEADLVEGVRAVGLDTYAGLPVRICRPVSLSDTETRKVIQHAVKRLGHRYDLKHIFDLMRWLLPTPPVPARFRRRLLTLGSQDPTRAICSTLVAECMHTVRYPILPKVERMRLVNEPDVLDVATEILHLRHTSLFVPRDFDLSPYFAVIKPTLARGFDHRQLVWGDLPVVGEAVVVAGDGQAAEQQPGLG